MMAERTFGLRTGRKLAVGLCVLISLICAVKPARGALLDVNGSFVTLVDDLKSLAFAKNSGLYVAPTGPQLAAFNGLATSLRNAVTLGDLQALVAAADALNYDVVRLNDSGTVYYGLREHLVANAQTLGWGSFFVRQGATRQAMVQTPHVLFDTNTPEVAAKAFVQSQAELFLMAGAHRDANGDDTADVAHLADSIFLEVHQAWNGAGGETIAWQVHGFDLDGKPQFPNDTDAVLSNGTGAVSPEIVALDAAIEALGNDWVSYAYNTLDINDPLNQQVNGNVDGETFGGVNGLGATTNVEQIYSTGIGGRFVHIELEQSFRLNGSTNRQLAADAIANAIAATTPIPEPASALSLGALTIMFIRRRR
ncbi:PEP-CTERM sorting domain-containing protein [Planctomycetales bacterium ZRK34]|nr:PEP-CTERM sorting domain-containing protein [Planctomycetales bacterium ZRK34]